MSIVYTTTSLRYTLYTCTCIGTGLEQCKGLIAVITQKYLSSQFCTAELYTTNSDRKRLFPIILEDIDFSSSERARGVKYAIGAINWTMFRPAFDDYATSLERLVQGMKEQGLGNCNTVHVVVLFCTFFIQYVYAYIIHVRTVCTYSVICIVFCTHCIYIHRGTRLIL